MMINLPFPVIIPNVSKYLDNLTPPIATLAIKQIAQTILFGKIVACSVGFTPIALLGIEYYAPSQYPVNSKEDWQYLFLYATISAIIGMAIYYTTWTYEKNFQQILLPQLEKIANGSSP